MPIALTSVRRFAVGLWLLGLIALVNGAQGQALNRELSQWNSVEPLQSGMSSEQLFAELVANNNLRSAAMREYRSNRTYRVSDPRGKVHAQEVGRMEYVAPDKKTFIVQSEAGSGLVRRLALDPLIASEVGAAAGKDRHDSAITPANYTLTLLGEQQMGAGRCFVASAVPKRVDKYLFEGKIWIDTHDYAVVRIEGHPAANLSFWITRADFVREYQKVDGFWLPKRDETLVHVRFYGKKVLTIDYQDYVVQGVLAEIRPASQ